ncbi:MAG: potassium transporter TrkG [Verrucomicrobiota bacterium JB022]|nr:potassium transporter TrkG [Verrucomicrobiota bacterium JB022]
MKAIWTWIDGWMRTRISRFVRGEPKRLLAFGYLFYILAGTGLLALPYARASTHGGWLDWLFTATSAVSTTGLVTLSTGHDYTFFGQLVIIGLIQMGGLGYMTFGSFVLLAASRRIDQWRERTQRLSLNLPEELDVAATVRLVVAYTLCVELVGAGLLWWLFASAGVEQPLWSAVFHSISAFCTAGFSLYDDSLTQFAANPGVHVVISTLSILGAMGFLIVNDFWRSLRRRKVGLTLTSRIILASTACLIGVCWLLLLFEEPLTAPSSGLTAWLNAFFQVMTASTTVGFNTLPIEQLSSASTLLLIVLMLVGASPVGTGGGMKTTTVTALWAIMVSVLKGRPEPTFAGKAIPEVRRRLAVATSLFYMLLLGLGIYLLAAFQPQPLVDIAFECASALGTVGLSRGLTGQLGDAGKLIVTALMFFGRVGPLLFAGALLGSAVARAKTAPEEDVVV